MVLAAHSWLIAASWSPLCSAPSATADLSAVLYSTYDDGQSSCAGEVSERSIDLSGGIFQKSLEQLWPILKPMTLGSIPVGLALAALSYVLVKPMVEAYKNRRRRELRLRSESEALGTR